MLRRTLRIGFRLGLLGGIAALVARLLSHDDPVPLSLASEPPQPWPPLTSDPAVPAAPTERAIPDPASPEAATVASSGSAWVEPVDGACPTSHPVKAKLASKIFHVPGGASYDRTTPDRCYRDAAAAEADGLRPAKR